MKLSTALVMALSQPLRSALGQDGRPLQMVYEPERRELLQNIVTWDEHSLLIHGERAMMFSGEFHPFRLPVPSLYLDVFQKIKALGLNMVSFYVDWALLEGTPGRFRADGIFALEPFFEAATEAGVYLLARPGPYINAEVSGGGFPGWLQRIKGVLRTDAGDYLGSTDHYMAEICAIIAKHQITEGGPVVLFQPENEHSHGHTIPFPNGRYFQYVMDQARKAGIVVPMISNDAGPSGNYAPGSGVGAVDIYGHDSYPLGFDCANPSTWPPFRLPTDFRHRHMKQSPKTPFSLVEFQGGSFDPWGGHGSEKCSALINHEFERVFYKNNYAAGVAIFNVYMVFGGTNWGNLGHPGGYTSYDYGACIRENGAVDREKYSELKLEAEFFKVSPGYLVATPGDATTGTYSTSEDVTITPLLAAADATTGNFFVVRHADYASTRPASYTLRLPTAAGTLTIPQGGGALTLGGRDSKMVVTDYPLGGGVLLYSTADVFTWKSFADRTVLVLYGGRGERHEFAVPGDHGGHGDHDGVKRLEDRGYSVKTMHGGALVVTWEALPDRQVIQLGRLFVYMLDRTSAYSYWVPTLPHNGSAYGTSPTNPAAVIVNGGYLVRSASVDGPTLSVQADFDAATTLEIAGVPAGVSRLRVNGKPLDYARSPLLGSWIATPDVVVPELAAPDLSALDWRRVDALPEIRPGYDDSAWPLADRATSDNTVAPLRTPVSLYGSDYGFHAGALVFRGHFTARSAEARLRIRTAGGSAFASAVWLGGAFLGAFRNAAVAEDANSTYDVPALRRGERYVLTVVVDTTGLNENFNPGSDTMKAPRGILDYALLSGGASDPLDKSPPDEVTTPISPWKLTGNLGGEDYADVFRGPLNEGGLFFERQGYHLPSPPLDRFVPGSSPFDGVDGPGIAYYVAQLTLDYPSDAYDIPLSFVFGKNQDKNQTADFRATLFVNGFQYGKYASNIGPQTEFPVPQGILDYNGPNWIGLAVWALDKTGAKLPGLKLKVGTAVQTSRQKVVKVDGPAYATRSHAY